MFHHTSKRPCWRCNIVRDKDDGGLWDDHTKVCSFFQKIIKIIYSIKMNKKIKEEKFQK